MVPASCSSAPGPSARALPLRRLPASLVVLFATQVSRLRPLSKAVRHACSRHARPLAHSFTRAVLPPHLRGSRRGGSRKDLAPIHASACRNRKSALRSLARVGLSLAASGAGEIRFGVALSRAANHHNAIQVRVRDWARARQNAKLRAVQTNFGSHRLNLSLLETKFCRAHGFVLSPRLVLPLAETS